MRITTLLLLSFMLSYHLEGQQTDTLLLFVKGSVCNQHTPIGYGMIIIFEDDPSKCDPLRGYEPVDEQIKHFKESLAAEGIDTLQFAKYSYSPQYYKSYPLGYSNRVQRKFILSRLTPEEVRKVNQISKRHFTDIESTVLEYEDIRPPLDLALSAFTNAKIKAQKIAYALGMKVEKVIRIDDVYGGPPYREVEGFFAYIDKHCYDLYVRFLLTKN